MTYEQIIEKLKANHFLSAALTTVKEGKSTITGIQIGSVPILQESNKARILEILEGEEVRIDWFPNQEYLLVTKK